ncbi:sensor histidine kinase [Natrinema marinum]|uniref:sensor histidine kinase n=1 Tax=Natrinema marinum TaxID=2961598 RepID=UPI0020C91FF8|nr:ATP-binding protein [Natrinema marinum]
MTRAGQSVVVVGDEPTSAHELGGAFDVVAIQDRGAVLERIETAAVDCVVVDGSDADRVETVAAIRKGAPAVPIIYATATPDGAAAAAATRAGATEYFTATADETLADRIAAVSADRARTATQTTATEIVCGDSAERDAAADTETLVAERPAALTDATGRHRRADVVTELLETTQALFSCESQTDVASVVVEAAERVLGFDIVGVRLYDPEAEALILTAASDTVDDHFEERKRVGIYESKMSEAFRRTEPIVFENIETESPYDYGSIRGAMTIPLGDHGLLNVGSPKSGAFDDHHVQLAQLLTASAAAALERADRREDLLRHEQVLETVEGMVYATDEDARFSLVTDPFAERLGYDREELLGEPASMVFDESKYDRAVEHVKRLLSDPEANTGPFETAYITADGEQFPVEIECSLLPGDDEGGTEEFRGTVNVVRDITQRKEREQYLQVLNRVLRHNLRNDLTVVIGYAELLCEHLEDRDLAAAASTLRQTATDLAATSEKTRAIQYALERDGERQPVDIAAIVDETVANCDIADGTVTVSAAGPHRALADPGVELVVDNLLENAIRHATPEPAVEISVTRDDGQIRLAVADDGPGIPPAEIDVVTGESDITQLTHSSGLGLWLVRWMVDSYGGTISFSKSAAGGSRVEVTLEAAPSSP